MPHRILPFLQSLHLEPLHVAFAMVAGSLGMMLNTVVQQSDWQTVLIHGLLSLVGTVITAWLAGQKRKERAEQLEFRRQVLASKSRGTRRRKPAAISRRKQPKQNQ